MTQVDARDGSLTRLRGDSITFHMEQVTGGDDEKDDEGDEQSQQAADRGRPAQEGADEQPAKESGEAASTESSTPMTVADSPNALASSTTATQQWELAANSLLPIRMLPSPDTVLASEAEALDGTELPDIPLSGIWQACGYQNLSDLMPNNIIRAFEPRLPDSQLMYDSMQEVERIKQVRVAQYGTEQPPVVTVARVAALAEEHLKRFKTNMHSRRRAYHTSTLTRSAPVSNSLTPACGVLVLAAMCLALCGVAVLSVLQLQSALHTALKRKLPSVTLADRSYKRHCTEAVGGQNESQAAAKPEGSSESRSR